MSNAVDKAAAWDAVAAKNAEIARLRAALAKVEAERDRQYDFAVQQIARNAKIEAENERLRAGGAPDGWRLVPVEPTRDMRQIGGEVNCPTETLTSAMDYACDVYAAMLAAAPEAPDMPVAALLAMAFDAGFDGTHVGWCSEYPSDARSRPEYKARRGEAVRAILAAPEVPGEGGDCPYGGQPGDDTCCGGYCSADP